MQKEVKQEQKPEQIPWFDYYIKRPLQGVYDLCAQAGEEILEVWYTLTGAWYCSHCEKYHGRRVYKNAKFDMRAFKGITYVCSLGLKNNNEKETESNDRAND